MPPRLGRGWDRLRLRPGPLRTALQVGLFPALMIGVPWIAAASMDRIDPLRVGLAVFLLTIPLFFVLERMLPWREEWIGSQGDVHTDVGLTLAAGLVGPLVEAASLTAALAILSLAAGGGDLGIWPTSWPLLAQGLLAMLVTDFFRYWFHRALHSQPWLWRIHATHHSPTRLYFFNGSRTHPLEVFSTGVVQSVPLVVIGATPEALAMYFVMGRVIGRFQHCNLDLRLGSLDWIFSSPRNHRWHHSRNLREAACNFGGDLIVWDHVFGTFFLPADREPPHEVGIEGMADFPKRLDRVLATPWTWNRYANRDPAAG